MVNMSSFSVFICLTFFIAFNSGLLQDKTTSLGPYYISDFKTTWYDAFRVCRRINLFLVSIETELSSLYLQQAITNHGLTSERFWTSGTNEGINPHYYSWRSTGQLINSQLYTNWLTDPSYNETSFVDVIIDVDELKWNTTTDFTETKLFICEEIPPRKAEDTSDLIDLKQYDDLYLSKNAVDWWEAFNTCRRNQLLLVAIENEEMEIKVNNMLNNTGTSNYTWISGTDLEKEGEYYWFSTGSSINNQLYSNWMDNQPDQANNGDCIGDNYNKNTNQSVGWDDEACEYSRVKSYLWTSGIDLDQENEFYWFSTGTSINNQTYNNWCNLQPDNVLDSDCIVENYPKSGVLPVGWDDELCSLSRRFICMSFY